MTTGYHFRPFSFASLSFPRFAFYIKSSKYTIMRYFTSILPHFYKQSNKNVLKLCEIFVKTLTYASYFLFSIKNKYFYSFSFFGSTSPFSFGCVCASFSFSSKSIGIIKKFSINVFKFFKSIGFEIKYP